MALQHPVDRDPAHLDASTLKEGVNPQGALSGVLSPELVDAIDEVAVDTIRAVVRTPGLVPEPLYIFLSVVSAPIAGRPLGDSEKLADLGGPNSLLEMLPDGVQSKTGHPH